MYTEQDGHGGVPDGVCTVGVGIVIICHTYLVKHTTRHDNLDRWKSRSKRDPTTLVW